MTNYVVFSMAIAVSAYCHCSKCCGKANQPTASGRWPVVGVSAAGPRSIPFGTWVRIPKYGWRRIDDRLSKKYDFSVDVFMRSHKEAAKVGRTITNVIFAVAD